MQFEQAMQYLEQFPAAVLGRESAQRQRVGMRMGRVVPVAGESGWSRFAPSDADRAGDDWRIITG